MANANAKTGTIVVGSPQNLSGVLFQKTNPETPLLNRIGVKSTNSVDFITGAEYSLANPAGVSISEDASMLAPAPKKTAFTNGSNRTQIFQRSVQETYRSMGNYGQLSSLQPAFVGATNNRPNKLQTEKAFQLQEMRRDLEYAILNSVYHKSASTDDADQTEGLIHAIQTNVVNAGGSILTYDLICDMGELLCAEFADGLERCTFLIDATVARQLASVISDSDKFVSSQSQFGANAMQVMTPFGVATFMRLSNKFLPAGTVVAADLNAMSSVVQNIPGKGTFFYEELAKVGASEQGQIYGEWGLDYGVEWLHGKFTNVAMTAPTTNAGSAVYVTNAADFMAQGAGDPLSVTVANASLDVNVANESLGVTVDNASLPVIVGNTSEAPVLTQEVVVTP